MTANRLYWQRLAVAAVVSLVGTVLGLVPPTSGDAAAATAQPADVGQFPDEPAEPAGWAAQDPSDAVVSPAAPADRFRFAGSQRLIDPQTRRPFRGNIPTSVIGSDGTSAWVVLQPDSLVTGQPQLVQIHTGAMAQGSAMSFGGSDPVYTGQVYPEADGTDSGYFGQWDAFQGRFARVNLGGGVFVSGFRSLDYSGQNQNGRVVASGMSADGAYVYFLSDYNPVQVHKFRRTGANSSFQWVLTTALFGVNRVRSDSASVDSTGTMWFVTRDTPARIRSLSLPGGDQPQNTPPTLGANFSVGVNNSANIVLASKTRPTLFVGLNTNPGQIVKINRLSGDVISRLNLAAGESSIWTGVLDPSGDFGYFGTIGTAGGPARIIKVNLLDNMTRVGALSFEPGEDRVLGATMAPDGSAAYFGAYSAPTGDSARYVKVQLSSLPVCGSAISRFTDVPNGAYFTRATSCLVQRGITNGVSQNPPRYAPERTVDRAQMATFLWRLAGEPAPPDPGRGLPCDFLDLDRIPAFATDAACWLGGVGITTNATYRPTAAVTRAEMAAFLWRMAGEPAGPTACGFSDGDAIPAFARQGACWLKANGITTVNPYRPNDPVTRAQMAAFIYRTGGWLATWGAG